MTYVINNYDGTPLVSVPDRTVNTTVTSIRLPGRDYTNYGEPVVENLIWMLQHFSAANPPLNPVRGQVWYDTNSQSLKVYSGSAWLGTGKTVVSSTEPLTGEQGQIYYNTARRQLFVYDQNSLPVWKLIGPLGAYDNNNGVNNAVPGYSTIEATSISTTSSSFPVLKVVVAGTLIAIVSNNALPFSPDPAITGFTTIQPGINLNATLGVFNGTATLANLATDSNSLGGKAAANYWSTDNNNVPAADAVYDLGSGAAKFANVYANLFQGTATSARYADVAERYHVDGPVHPGDVVQLGGAHEIELCDTLGSDQVLGVVSTNPAIMLNSAAGDDTTHPYVALTGRTPCKVVGAVRKGDRLMAGAQPGTACVWTPEHSVLSILGRSLHTDLNEQVKLVEIVVGVR